MKREIVKKPGNMQSTVRDRARPKAVLVPRKTEPLVKFIQRLGVVMYGADWVRVSGQSSTSAPAKDSIPGSYDDCYSMICGQMLSALRLGLLIAIVELKVTVREDVRRTPTSSLNTLDDGWSSVEDDLTREPEWFESDDGSPKQHVFGLKRSFWDGSADQFQPIWSSGVVTGSQDAFEHIEERSGTSTSIYNAFSAIDSEISIRDPDQALDQITCYSKLPDEKWLSRYRAYRKHTRIEAVAAGWRDIAISGLKPETGSSELGRRMHQYLIAQGLEIDGNTLGEVKQTLREMAKNMLYQLKIADQESSVLISSNPRKHAGDKR